MECHFIHYLSTNQNSLNQDPGHWELKIKFLYATHKTRQCNSTQSCVNNSDFETLTLCVRSVAPPRHYQLLSSLHSASTYTGILGRHSFTVILYSYNDIMGYFPTNIFHKGGNWKLIFNPSLKSCNNHSAASKPSHCT